MLVVGWLDGWMDTFTVFTYKRSSSAGQPLSIPFRVRLLDYLNIKLNILNAIIAFFSPCLD